MAATNMASRSSHRVARASSRFEGSSNRGSQAPRRRPILLGLHATTHLCAERETYAEPLTAGRIDGDQCTQPHKLPEQATPINSADRPHRNVNNGHIRRDVAPTLLITARRNHGHASYHDEKSNRNKLYAVRDESGKFKDIQTYKRAHTADMRHKSKAEKEAAQGPIERRVRKTADDVVKSVKRSVRARSLRWRGQRNEP
jgi:hypothetical protein